LNLLKEWTALPSDLPTDPADYASLLRPPFWPTVLEWVCGKLKESMWDWRELNVYMSLLQATLQQSAGGKERESQEELAVPAF
jgi:hypothetical protein